jgi:hypothetical protein
VLEPGFADGLVVLRLMAAGTEPLTQFPVMPGEMVEEKLLNHIDPLSRTVTTESELFALRDEIVDMIAIRQRLINRMKSRFEAKNWTELKLILDEYKALPSKDDIDLRLTKLHENLKAEAAKTPKLKVLTKTASNLLSDTHGLVDRYLVDDDYLEHVDALQRHELQAQQEKGIAKALPKMPTIGAGGKQLGPPGVVGSPSEFSPPGGGFTVLMPGTPVESTAKTPDGTSEVRIYKIAVPGKGVFNAAYWDYPVAIAEGDVDRVLNLERDRLVATIPGAKINRDSPATVGGQPGKEIEFEGPPGRTGEVPTSIARITLVNSRVFSVSIGGTKALVTAPAAAEFLNSFASTGRGAKKPPAVAEEKKPAPVAPASTAAGAKSAIEKAKKAASSPPQGGGNATPF